MTAQPKPSKWILWLVLATGFAAIVLPILLVRKGMGSEPAPVVAAEGVRGVSCAGRIEPMEPVTRVAAPYINGHPAVVANLKVNEGDRVKTGDVLAVLEGRAQLEASLHQVEARIALQQARLDQARARPKSSDLAAQKAETARWQAGLENAQSEARRYEALHQKLDVSAVELAAKRAEVENARNMLEESKARLASLSELRPEDIRVAESELEVARTEVERLRVEIASTLVRSPGAGVVIRVRARKGEEVGPQGILDLAKTEKMGVIAEVYETDIARIKPGQKAQITGEMLPAKLEGAVALVGSEIGRADVVPTDPASFVDSRVVRVHIRLPENAPVAGLIHGKVSVVFAP